MPGGPLGIVIAAAALLVLLVLLVLVLRRYVVPVAAGQALVINRLARIDVTYSPTFVPPLLALGELVDVSRKTITLERLGKDGFSCRDCIRAEVTAELTVSVSLDAESIIRLAQAIGAARTFGLEGVRDLFAGKLAEALAAVIVELDFEEIAADPHAVRDRVIEMMGRDYEGYVIEELVLTRIEQVSREAHDPHHVRDARGIRLVTERTVDEARRTASLERELRVDTARLRCEAETLVAELLAARSDALGRLQAALGRRIDIEAVDREIDRRLRLLAKVSERAGSTDEVAALDG